MARRSHTDVVVIGGGSTGTGVARDLAMRGLDVTLFERGRLTDGTTGRMHGLLHSGARYADGDPRSARDCIVENTILRDIAAHCVEETGGLFVQRSDDDEAYFDRKLEACRACDIPVEPLTGAEARAREPCLHPDVVRAFAVPDAAIDPFRVVVANALDIEAHGGRVETHAEVVDVLVEDGAVRGVSVQYGSSPNREEAAGKQEIVTADYIVNATGAWGGQLTAMIGSSLDIVPSKGVMVVTNCRQLDTVINRCAPRADGDIIVPHETTAILGTTDVIVDDPDDFAEAKWEVDLMIERLSALVPVLEEARTLRSYWGVRPLFDPKRSAADDPTALTRDFAIIDHRERDDLAGFVSIVGGKFATYRLMAEQVSDHVCARLDVSGRCRTATVPLPGSEDVGRLARGMDTFGLRSPIARRSRERLGSRAPDVLDTDPNPVICGCEAVTRAEIRDAIEQCGSDLNGVRIRTRASMGNCQGGECVMAMATELYPAYPVDVVTDALAALYDERWKGQRHALWGEQLRQAMRTYVLHTTTLHREQGEENHRIDFAEFYGGADGDRE